MQMPSYIFEQMWLAITKIEAQEILKAMSTSETPYLKESAASKRYHEMRKLAEGTTKKNTESLSNADVARILGLGELKDGRR